MRFQPAWLLALLALALIYAYRPAAPELQLHRVLDGDTLILNPGKQRVRLLEIDAPEISQPYGQASRQSLSELCQQARIRLDIQGKDQYGRSLARVYCNDLQVNTEQIRRGMAWVYDQYVQDKSLYPVQQAAQQAKRGLWSQPRPEQPWRFRQRQPTR